MIGTFFRGPNWALVIPWEKPVASGRAPADRARPAPRRRGGNRCAPRSPFISVVVLAIHGVVFYNQFFARWQDHQTEYFKDAAAASTTPP